MYCTSKEMLEKARGGAYAVGAFNFENMEMALAIVSAAEKMKAPCILQTTPSTVAYAAAEGRGREAALGMWRAIAYAAASQVSVPVACHLDHGDTAELAEAALKAGYSSVMIDGSRLPFDENIALSTSVAASARAAGVPVETELGTVGGKEDSDASQGPKYTDPGKVAEFVRRTRTDSLAVGIGTSHGIYAGEPFIRTDLLADIRDRLERDGLGLPLVLHGSSGLSDEVIRECVRLGICKVNFATELRQAFTGACRDILERDGSVYDPKKYGRPAMKAVAEKVCCRISVLGSEGKAF